MRKRKQGRRKPNRSLQWKSLLAMEKTLLKKGEKTRITRGREKRCLQQFKEASLGPLEWPEKRSAVPDGGKVRQKAGERKID